MNNVYVIFGEIKNESRLADRLYEFERLFGGLFNIPIQMKYKKASTSWFYFWEIGTFRETFRNMNGGITKFSNPVAVSSLQFERIWVNS